MTLELDSYEQTQQFARGIGARLQGGECIELISDLGGGKTTFTKGLLKGAGSNETVSSPTFTISNVYHTPKFEVHHYDFYRLSESGVVAEELAESVERKDVVIVIEWAEIATDVLPAERIVIHIDKDPLHADIRHFQIAYPENYDYLFGEEV